MDFRKMDFKKIAMMALIMLSSNVFSHTDINSSSDFIITGSDDCNWSSYLVDDNSTTIYGCNQTSLVLEFQIKQEILDQGVNAITLSLSEQTDTVNNLDSLYIDYTQYNPYSYTVIYDGSASATGGSMTVTFDSTGMSQDDSFFLAIDSNNGTAVSIKDMIVHHNGDDISGILDGSQDPSGGSGDTGGSSDDDDSGSNSGSTRFNYTAFKMPLNVRNPLASSSVPSGSSGASNSLCSEGSLSSSMVAALNDDFDGSSYNGDTNFWCSVTDIFTYTNGTANITSNIKALTQLEAIRVTNENMTSLPNEVCELSNLRQISMSNNNLTTLPSCIGDLTELTYINLGNNNISSLPSGIGGLMNLTQLLVSGNIELTSIPSEIGNMSSLKYLYFDDTSLYTIPVELSNLASQLFFYVRNSDLHSVPAELLDAGFLTFDYSNNPDIIFE